jgi:hypothetical protein
VRTADHPITPRADEPRAPHADRSPEALRVRRRILAALEGTGPVGFRVFASWAREAGVTHVACELIEEGLVGVREDGHVFRAWPTRRTHVR